MPNWIKKITIQTKSKRSLHKQLMLKLEQLDKPTNYYKNAIWTFHTTISH